MSEREKPGGTLQRFIRRGSSLRSNRDVREREREKPGGTLQRFIRRDSSLRSNPLSFYVPFLGTHKLLTIFFNTKDTRFVYLHLTNGTPFTLT